MDEIIVVEELVKTFGDVIALDGLSLKFFRGINGFLGPNGSGKTTTLKIIMGLLKPDSGSVSILGVDPIVNGVEVRRILGYFPERDILDVDVVVNKLVVHLGIVAGLSREEAVKRFSDIATFLDLGEEIHRPLSSLSHGMRQKIKLAVALIHDPEILLLDEPTSGLDPIARQNMLDLIKLLWSELDISIVLSTHILRDVEAVCDRVVVINEGKRVFEGHISELKTQGTRELFVKFIGGEEESNRFIELIESFGFEWSWGRYENEIRIPLRGDVVDLVKKLISASLESGVVLRFVGFGKLALEGVFKEVVG